MADVMVALDRADLPPEAIDTAVRTLADEGVDVLDVPVEDDTFTESEIRQAERVAAADTAAGAPQPATWSGSTCGRSAGCRC